MAGGYPGVKARGNKIQISFSYQGIRCRETLPISPSPTNLKKAFQLRELVNFDITIGAFDYAKRFPYSKNAIRFAKEPGTLITVEKAANDWLKQKQSTCEMSTIRDYKSIIGYYLIPTFGSKRLSELKSKDIKNWYYSLEISSKRKNNVLGVFHNLLENAVKDELIVRNPVSHISREKNHTREPEPFSIEEMNQIIDGLPVPIKYQFQFAFWTGLRTSEHLALEWSDVDLDRNVIFVRKARVRGVDKGPKTKNGVRTVELLPAAREALVLQSAFSNNSQGTVFFDPRNGEPWKNDQALRRCYWQPTLAKIGVNYRCPYQTRHTYASHRLMENCNSNWVANQMGHHNPMFTCHVYARWIDPHKNP